MMVVQIWLLLVGVTVLPSTIHSCKCYYIMTAILGHCISISQPISQPISPGLFNLYINQLQVTLPHALPRAYVAMRNSTCICTCLCVSLRCNSLIQFNSKGSGTLKLITVQLLILHRLAHQLILFILYNIIMLCSINSGGCRDSICHNFYASHPPY